LSSAKMPPRWVTGLLGLLLTAKTLRTETGRVRHKLAYCIASYRLLTTISLLSVPPDRSG